MARRLDLHEKFCDLLGTRNVYFQPPESVKLKYDCITYKTSNRNDLIADDTRYRGYTAYEVTFITRDPDSLMPEEIMNSFTYIVHNSTYVADNLHHDVFTIYY